MNQELTKLSKQYTDLLITPNNDFIRKWLLTARLPYIIIKSSELNANLENTSRKKSVDTDDKE